LSLITGNIRRGTRRRARGARAQQSYQEPRWIAGDCHSSDFADPT
jgi:hypothetical protein